MREAKERFIQPAEFRPPLIYHISVSLLGLGLAVVLVQEFVDLTARQAVPQLQVLHKQHLARHLVRVVRVHFVLKLHLWAFKNL